MSEMTKREFLKRLGIGAAGIGAGAAMADETNIGDSVYKRFNRMIVGIDRTMEDGPSAFLRDGKVVQPERTVPVFSEADVVVVGGGPAGVSAALSAARGGAKTVLVERYGCLGGLMTHGMVLILLSIGVMENGKYKLVTKGICEDFMNRLKGMGPMGISNRDYLTKAGKWQPDVDPQAAKVLLDRMVKEAGIEMVFHAWGVDVIQEGNAVRGVIVESKQGRQAILAKCVVDASGDGDVYFQAGANYRQIKHGLGMVRRLGNVDRMSDEARKKFKLRLGDQPAPSCTWGTGCLGPEEQSGNGLDLRDLTAKEIAHRESMWQQAERIRQTAGGGDVFLMDISTLGTRASRLLDAEYIVNQEDAIGGKRFEDCVAVCGDDTFTRPEFQVPYRALLPKGVENVVACGRCIGCNPNIIDRIRLIGPCFVTGHAAGAAAAVAVKSGKTPRMASVKAIRDLLKKQGAYLG